MAESDLKELLGLVQDTAEYTSYMRELGVEGTEEQPGGGRSPAVVVAPVGARHESEAPHLPAPENIAALRRNAFAAERRAPAAQAQQPTSADDDRKTEKSAAPPAASERTEMVKKKKYPDPEPPPPQETLFGTITPQDEESLPRSNETLQDIWNDIGECMRCPLSQSRTRVVNSEGNPKARLMFIGEAPGADEDATGRPFVGRAGQLLNKIIEAIGLKRDDIMIGNVNRCRPPQNRTPTMSEAATCKPFLLREIAIIRPDVIVVLGNTAMKNLLDTKEGITRLRGQFQDYRGIKVMPTFHPAYLLRDPSKKREAWEDMKKVRDYLNTVISEK
ncbi:MAG TPA: uracil-DNA glycosylase [Pyrinomonadaceae bacterium]|jgi:DNA polymerase|nr:uracil-DNA glycosylase [Pyrinomonadaceae bacterium]